MNSDCTAQMAFIFGGLLGQNVTFEGLTALDGATRTNAETLFGAALGLHFGHSMLLFICAREALRTFRRLDGPEPLVSGEFLTPPLAAAGLTPPPLESEISSLSQEML
jgi:hypothetical protein